ncbi:MAG: VWA domain-containing protein [Acidobacteriota bacterium]
MRSLAVLLLVLAFSRPYVATDDPVAGSSARKSVVILLDNSFSMRAGDRFERAKAEALRVLGTLRNDDSCVLVAFSDTSAVLNEPHSERKGLVTLIQELKPSFRPTDFGQAIKLAGQLLSSVPNETQEIHLVSDFQQSGWKQEAAAVALPEKVKIVPHRIDGQENGNNAVTRVEVAETGARGQVEIKVAARIASSQKLSAPITVRVNGKVVGEKRVESEAGQTTLVEFAPWTLPAGINRGTVTLRTDDELPEDNSAFFVVNPLARQKLLLLTEAEAAGRPGAYTEDLYIRKALASGPGAPFDIVTEAAGRAPADLSPFSAVLINDPAVLPAWLAAKLAVFVNNGGGLVIGMGDRSNLRELNEKIGNLLPARLIRKRQAIASGLPLITNIQKQHSVFRVFQPVHQSYFLTTPFRAYVETSPIPGSSVLMELGQGAPLLLERITGKGRVLLYTSAFSTGWNDLPLKAVFLPFCHELVKYAMRFEGAGDSLRVGESVPVSRLNPNFEKALEKVSDTGSAFRQGWKISSPGGQAIRLSEQELVNSPFLALEEPGFYETEVWNQHNVVAVNLNPAESDLTPVDPKQVLRSIERTAARPDSEAQAGPLAPDERAARERSQSLWWYLILVATGLLVAEGKLANHYRTQV